MGIIYSSNHKTNIAVGNDENDYVIIMNKNENNYDVSIPIVDSNCPCDVSVKDTIDESKPIPNNFPCEVTSVNKDTIDEINCPCDVSVKDTIDCPKPVDEINFVINPLNDIIKKKKKKRKNKNK